MIKVHDNIDYQTLIEEIENIALDMRDEAALLLKIEQLGKIAEEEQDIVLRTVVKYHSSDIPYKREELKKCQQIMLETMQLCKENNISYYMMRCYNTLAILDSKRADYYGSITNYLQALHITNLHPEFQYGAILLNNIGNLFVWLEEHEAAVDYLIQSYHKYYEENNDSNYLLSIFVLNIIEEYSKLNKYDEAREWSKLNIDFIQEAKEAVDMILSINKIYLFYRNGEPQAAAELSDRLLKETTINNNTIYIFRGFLRLWGCAIEAGDEETAKKVYEKTAVISRDEEAQPFQYDYTVLKFQHYKTFEKETDDGKRAKEVIEEYVEQSEHIIKQLRNTYARRMMVEKELLTVKGEIETALNQSHQLQKDIELDYFTHILNKVSLEKYIDVEILQKTESTYQAMLLIDIDYFKSVNDTYGHKRGDEMILKVVDIISLTCSQNMLFGRFGGDEFIIFIKNARKINFFQSYAEEVLERARHIEISAEKHITLSIGIHILEGKENSFKESFQKADLALYEAKKNGRDRYYIYKES